MSRSYVIRPGDSLANIAYENGLLVETLWLHPDNAALRERRPDRNILMPGDVLAIPAKRVGRIEAATGQRHRFRLKDVPHQFRLQLFDNEIPRRRQAYKLTVRGAGFTAQRDGTTDERGVLSTYIPPRARDARLSIDATQGSPLELDILFGSLDPVEELSGVQKRLANLGFACPVDGRMSGQTRHALESFQQRFALAVTGEADEATRQRLRDMNEGVSKFPPPVNNDGAARPSS
jgi:N-acetylmuramoyl-L-alanine amidase